MNNTVYSLNEKINSQFLFCGNKMINVNVKLIFQIETNI